jgi:hypothetical protein
MTDEIIFIVGIVALPIAILGIILSIISLLWQAYTKRRDARAEIIAAHEVAIVEDSIHERLITAEIEIHGPEKVPNYRHNIHCPLCGRFSKRVFGLNDVVECSAHGVQVRWRDIPTDWASVPLYDRAIMTVEPVYANKLVGLVPITQPIDIIVPDDLSDLYEMGAVI